MLTALVSTNIINPMFSRLLRINFCLLALTALLLSSQAEAAKYAGEPFQLGVGARPLGIGGAYVAHASDVTAGFWNPSGLASLTTRQVTFMHSETFGSLLNHDYLAYAMPLRSDADSPVAGVSLTRLGGGGIKITEWDYNLNRPLVVKESGHADYQLLFSWADKKSPRLSFGASAKLLYRDIADNSAFGIGADVGAQYELRSDLRIGVMVRDFTTTLLSYDTGTKESIYPTVVPGLSFQRYFGEFSFLAAADAEVKFENYREAAQFWMGSFSVDSHFGAEIGYRDVVFGRAGSDMGNLALGAGVAVSSFFLDIAYMRNTDIDDSFRISILYDIE